MPKSKRSKVVPLTKTAKKGHKLKETLVEELHLCCDVYKHIFVIKVENMRNKKLKEVRTLLVGSRFFFGKNKIMQKALGKDHQDEYKDELSKLSARIQGNCGIFFTNNPKEEVFKFFNNFSDPNYARSGVVAIEDISLAEGPLDLPFSMEVHLRSLGLKTQLKDGVIHLLADTVLCNKGDVLTPEQCRLLELLDIKMAEFRIQVDAVWSEGVFERISEDDDAQPEGQVEDDEDMEEDK